MDKDLKNKLTDVYIPLITTLTRYALDVLENVLHVVANRNYINIGNGKFFK